jgi:Electron transfer DM13
MKKLIILIVLTILFVVLYYAISPLFINVAIDEQLPKQNSNSGTSSVKRVEIIDTKTHPASGTVTVIDSDEGKYVRYEDFKTINGPDLFVYLAKDLDAKSFVNLGELRATEGNINYKIPEGTDISNYKYVMVWCKQFGVLFNYADISEIVKSN